MRLLATADVHGNTALYTKLFELMASRKYAGAAIVGDICPGFDIVTQRKFLSEWLIPKLRVLRQSCAIPLFLIMGNDDFLVNSDFLKAAEKERLLEIAHMSVRKLDKFWIVGYSYINPTPFIIKDWEKDEKDIEKDLVRLTRLSDPKKTVYLIHVPPYGTDLDMLYNGEHVGSLAVRTFIEQYQPWLTIHGHIHESPTISGHFGQYINRTLSIGCGQRILDIDIGKRTFKLIG